VKGFLLIALLLLAMRSFSAVGDITGADIEASGWAMRLWVSGLNTNGSINNGFTLSNNPASPKLTLRISSNGYNADGTTTTVQRLVFGTKVIRFAWSNAAANGPPGPHTNQVFTDGNGCIVRCALSEYVCSKDGVTLDALSGAYAVTNGTGTNSSAITGLAVTNGSTQPYPKALAFPRTVPWQVVSGNQFPVDIVAAHYFAAGGLPVKAVHFWAVDADGHRSPTNIETAPIVDLTTPTPTVVYRSWVWQTNFTAGVAGTNFTNYVKVFPRVGDAASVWDSSDGTYDADSPYLGPQVFFSNRNGDYSICFACVDRTNGVAAGNIYTNLAQLTAAPVCFTNIQTALNGLAVTNLTLFNKSNWDNCVILLTNGRHGWISDPDTPTATTRSPNRSWLTISNYPGISQADSVIYTNRGSQNIQKTSKVKFSGLTIDYNGSSGIFNVGHHAVWVDRCNVLTNAQAGGALSQFNTNCWLTFSSVARHRYGLKASGQPPGTGGTPANDRWHLWGNRFTCYLENAWPATFMGNIVIPDTNSPTALKNDGQITTWASFDPWTFYCNQMFRLDASALPLAIGLSTNILIGTLVAQNVIEVSTNGTQPPYDVMQSAKPGEVSTNMIVWNNTILSLYHEPYNHETNQQLYSVFYSHVGNLFHDFEGGFDGNQSGSTSTQDPWRTNRWNLMYGVGNVGNAMIEKNGNDITPECQGVQGNYGFNGLFCAYYSTNNSGNAFNFIRDASLVGATTGNGNGDYRLKSYSPLFQYVAPGQFGWVMPYDIDGHSRSAVDPPGAFVSGNPKQAPIGF